MKILFSILFLIFSSPSIAQVEHPDLRPFSTILNAQIYAGFGLARDMINHVYKDQIFQPRDYDLAVVGSSLNEEQAIETLKRHGRIVKVLDMAREEIKPNGNIFSYHYGFVVIIETDTTQIDFKFFNTAEDAHTRGLFDVEKVLIPLENRTLSEMISDLREYKRSGSKFNYLDPHKGFSSILEKSPKTVNWAKAAASPIDWVIRGAMIAAKLDSKGLPTSEIPLMTKGLKKTQFITGREIALIKRAVAHKKSWRVRELLKAVGFFEQFSSWIGNTEAKKLIEDWQKPIKTISCKKII